MIWPHGIVLFVIVPLLAGAINVALHSFPRLQRWVVVVALVVNLVLAVATLGEVYRGESNPGAVLVSQMGNWPAPFGITLVVDALSAVMLCVSAAVTLGVYLYALSQLERRFAGGYFHAVYPMLLLGVNFSFITGDLFNLFVAFEVMLMASYVLLCAGTTRPQLRQAYKYIILNVVASTLFVMACGFIYGHLGTLNLADLARLAAAGQIPRTAVPAILLLLVVFASKTAAFPVWYWLPDSYPTMPPAIGGLFSGLLTKVGVYALIRVFLMVFGADPDIRFIALTSLLVSSAGTMFIGVLGAVSSHGVRRILSIHVISQVGYMILGVGLGTELALAATVLYMIQHMIVKTTLFLCCGMMEKYAGGDELGQLGGLLRRDGWLAAMFLIAALSLAGLPPLSGFFGKFLLLIESLRLVPSAAGYALATVALLTSLLTLLSMVKIWSFAFWSPAPARVATALVPQRRGAAMAAIGVMVALALSVGLGAGAYLKVATVAARGILDSGDYIRAVLGESSLIGSAPLARANNAGEGEVE